MNPTLIEQIFHAFTADERDELAREITINFRGTYWEISNGEETHEGRTIMAALVQVGISTGILPPS